MLPGARLLPPLLGDISILNFDRGADPRCNPRAGEWVFTIDMQTKLAEFFKSNAWLRSGAGARFVYI